MKQTRYQLSALVRVAPRNANEHGSNSKPSEDNSLSLLSGAGLLAQPPHSIVPLLVEGWKQELGFSSEAPMKKYKGILTGVVLLCSTPAAEAVSPGRMISSMQSGICPKDASAVVIYSKDPFCAFYHLSGDQCQHNWKEYWKLTAQYNEFLEHCRMEKKVSHLQ